MVVVVHFKKYGTMLGTMIDGYSGRNLVFLISEGFHIR